MLQDIEDLKASNERLGDAVEELQELANRTRVALDELQESGRLTRVALESIHTEVTRNANAFTKLGGGIQGLMETLGSVEARVDDHEARLQRIEQTKQP